MCPHEHIQFQEDTYKYINNLWYIKEYIVQKLEWTSMQGGQCDQDMKTRGNNKTELNNQRVLPEQMVKSLRTWAFANYLY